MLKLDKLLPRSCEGQMGVEHKFAGLRRRNHKDVIRLASEIYAVITGTRTGVRSFGSFPTNKTTLFRRSVFFYDTDILAKSTLRRRLSLTHD